ncbi:hypothetical protein PIB30_057253 [Stylosanthes scabra]|uniref:Putative plant transposon protein domain-containing protein n=1 Tax=Stylosanthes scabra TaxID=79078 RepID=A0ABU6VMR2_9FABA|nr:hypothetical protein [Stylosanthes scabra]
MASSSSTVSVFDVHRFRKAHNEQLFYSYARGRKVIPEVGFNLEEDEYPEIMEQIALRAVSDEEVAVQEKLPYKSFVRGKEVDFSPSNIKRVMRFKRETAGAQTDYKTRQALDQRLDEVLADLCISGATWKLSSSQPPVPIQLKRTEFKPLAKGWQEFIIHSLVPTGNKSEVTTSRAILIHTIMQGEDVRAEEIIAHNMVTIAQGLASKGNLAYLSTIYKLCKDTGVPFREFIRTPRIPALSYITAKRMETIRFPRNQPQPQQEDEEEDEPMSQADGGNFEEEDQQPPQQDQQPQQHGFPNFQPRYESQYHEDLQGIEETLSKQEKLAKEIQEVRRSQLAQAVANNQRLEAERNMQLALERQGRDIVEIRKQVNLWTNNVSSKEAYACWAQQQANLNLSEIPITQIPDIMRTNVEKGRPLFHGFLKSDYGASSSSQVDPEESVPLRTAPPSLHFRPPYPPPN